MYQLFYGTVWNHCINGFRSSEVFVYNIKVDKNFDADVESSKTEFLNEFAPDLINYGIDYLPAELRYPVRVAQKAAKFWSRAIKASSRARQSRNPSSRTVPISASTNRTRYTPRDAFRARSKGTTTPMYGPVRRRRRMSVKRRKINSYSRTRTMARSRGRYRKNVRKVGRIGRTKRRRRVLGRSSYRRNGGRRYKGRLQKRRRTPRLRSSVAKAVRREVGDCFNQAVFKETAFIGPRKADVYDSEGTHRAPFIARASQYFNTKCDWLPLIYQALGSSLRAANAHLYPEKSWVTWKFTNPNGYDVFLKVDELQVRQGRYHAAAGTTEYKTPESLTESVPHNTEHYWTQHSREYIDDTLGVMKQDQVLSSNYYNAAVLFAPTRPVDDVLSVPQSNVNPWEWNESNDQCGAIMNMSLSWVFPKLKQYFKVKKYIRLRVKPGQTVTLRKPLRVPKMIPYLTYADTDSVPILDTHSNAFFWRQYTTATGQDTYPWDNPMTNIFGAAKMPAGLIVSKEVKIRWRSTGDTKPSFYSMDDSLETTGTCVKPFDVLHSMEHTSMTNRTYTKTWVPRYCSNDYTHTSCNVGNYNGGKLLP